MLIGQNDSIPHPREPQRQRSQVIGYLRRSWRWTIVCTPIGEGKVILGIENMEYQGTIIQETAYALRDRHRSIDIAAFLCLAILLIHILVVVNYGLEVDGD